jgi:putative hemolysin
MISSLTALIFIRIFGDSGKWTAIAVLTPLFLVFCEAVPKTVAKINPIAISKAVSPLLLLFFRLLLPVSWVLEKVSGWLMGPFRPTEPSGGDELTEGELRVLIDAGHEDGVLQKPHRDLIHRVFELVTPP